LLATGGFYEGAALWASGDWQLLQGAPLAVAGAASLGLGVQLLTAAVIQVRCSSPLPRPSCHPRAVQPFRPITSPKNKIYPPFSLGLAWLASWRPQGPGAVTLKVLSQVRNAGLVLAGVALYGERVNAGQGGGYVVSLAAFAAYSALESHGSKSPHNNGKGDLAMPVSKPIASG
jgi:hypothetical protein